jgi:hypothetical protein
MPVEMKALVVHHHDVSDAVGVESFPAWIHVPLSDLAEHWLDLKRPDSLELWFANGGATYRIDGWSPEFGLVCRRTSPDEWPAYTPEETFHRREHRMILKRLDELGKVSS